MKIKLTILLITCVCHSASYAQETFDTYYFAVGSGHYEKDLEVLEEGFYGLPDVANAVNSAARVATLFESMGAKGETLASQDFTFITRKRLFKGLDQAIKNAKKQKSQNTLFIFYYCGHGFTNNDLQAMFIPPGDISIDMTKRGYEEWLDYTISPIEIKERLDESGLRYMIIMDSCVEGDPKKVREIEYWNPSLVQLLEIEQLDALTRASFEIVIALNKMVGPDPTIFSTISGHSVTMLDYPFKSGKKEVGPLCYRMHKIIEESLNGMDITLMDFMVMMTNANLDGKTQNGVTYWKNDDMAWNYLRKP